LEKVELDPRLYRVVKQIVREQPEFGYQDEDEFVRETIRMAFRTLLSQSACNQGESV